MDPAFSLADELAAATSSSTHEYQLDDELDFHHHHHHHPGSDGGYAGGASLDDELAHDGGGGGYGSLDAELDGMHIGYSHGNDLASELGGVGSLAAELEGGFPPPLHQHEAESQALSRTASSSNHEAQAQSASTSIAALASAQQEQVDASMAATTAFLSKLSSASLSSSARGEQADTERIESLASRLLKTLAECTVEREAQLRELRELNRKLSLAEPVSSSSSYNRFPASSSLSSSLSLPTLDEQQEPYPPSSLTDGNDLSHTTSASIDSNLTLTQPDPLISTPLSPSPLVHANLFAPLYTTTSEVVTSLGALHETTQITKSTTADAQRKLKSLKTLLHQWRMESDSVQASEEYIASLPAPPNPTTTSSAEQWAKEQKEWCSQRIAAVEASVTRLLTPVAIGSSA